MASRRSTPPPKAPDFPPEKTHAALKRQLSALDAFQDQNYNESRHNEQEWANLTLNILTHGFGEDSANVSQFHHARSAGVYNMRGVSPAQMQRNFEERTAASASMLRSSLGELELLMPQPAISGAYETGSEYQFYKDLKTIVGFAANDLFVIDNYLDTQLFDVYMENVGAAIGIRVLTNQVSATLETVARKFALQRNLELRSSRDVHDRVVFSDDRCWVIGQSIKDAARKKPTYIIEHTGTTTMKTIYEAIWVAASVVVKS